MTVPLFSSRVGHTLLSQSPRHAWWQHPTLNPEYVEEESDAFDLGTAAHAYLLQGETGFTIIDLPDWRTKIARDTRDAARAAGKTPLLAHRWASVQAMAAAAREQLERVEPPTPFIGGEAEKSLFFELDGVACRATPDWLSIDRTLIVDLKSTGVSAHPGAWAKTVWGNGNAIQNALYRRAVQHVYGVTAEFKWVVVETYPPFALSVVALDPEAEAFSDQQVTEALRLWRHCLEANDWPAYSARTAYIEAPAWIQAQWLERSYYSADFQTR